MAAVIMTSERARGGDKGCPVDPERVEDQADIAAPDCCRIPGPARHGARICKCRPKLLDQYADPEMIFSNEQL